MIRLQKSVQTNSYSRTAKWIKEMNRLRNAKLADKWLIKDCEMDCREQVIWNVQLSIECMPTAKKNRVRHAKFRRKCPRIHQIR